MKQKETAEYMKILLIPIVLIVFFFWQNNSILVSNHSYKSDKLPQDFNGFKILHISDFHNKSFGKNQAYILNKIKGLSPDIIVITGDLVDRRRFDLDTSLIFVEGALSLAPIYYVPGNHEAWSGKYDLVSRELKNLGVYVLENEKLQVTKGTSSIEILGLMDPGFHKSSYIDKADAFVPLKNSLALLRDDKVFQVLLSHRPELLDLYSEANIDIIFAGHAHGGQFRLPFIGGLVAPDQGFFPKYTEGSHIKGNSTLYISRGLGNSIVPIRIFNRPELILLTFEK